MQAEIKCRLSDQPNVRICYTIDACKVISGWHRHKSIGEETRQSLAYLHLWAFTAICYGICYGWVHLLSCWWTCTKLLINPNLTTSLTDQCIWIHYKSDYQVCNSVGCATLRVICVLSKWSYRIIVLSYCRVSKLEVCFELWCYLFELFYQL